MRRAPVTPFLLALASVVEAAPVSIDEQLPTVSRDRLTISTVRRGDLVRRLEATGATRRTDASLEAVLHVKAEAVHDLMVGQPALVAVARRLLPGKVAGIQPAGGSDFQVRVAVDGAAALGLTGGEPVAGLIETEELNGVLIVGAVSGVSPGSMVSWFRLDGDAEHATRVRVAIGQTAQREAEIWSGLAEGDRVITQGIELPAGINRVRIR